MTSGDVCQRGRCLKWRMRIGVLVELLDLRWERSAPGLYLCIHDYINNQQFVPYPFGH